MQEGYCFRCCFVESVYNYVPIMRGEHEERRPSLSLRQKRTQATARLGYCARDYQITTTQLLQMVLRLLQNSTALWRNEHHKRNHSVDPEHGTYNKKIRREGVFRKKSVCVCLCVCGAHVVVQRGEMSSIMHAEHLHTLFSVVCDDG